MKSLSELYLTNLDGLMGEPGRAYDVTDPGETHPVFVTIYDNIPEDGYITGFSFGLSSLGYAEWINSRPELMISVRSLDDSWVLCMGEIIRCHRGKIAFSYGSILHFRQQISDDCHMTSFLVFASTLLDASQQRILLPDRQINISQIYPIYEEEAVIIHQVGVERFFWDFEIDFSDVHRSPAKMR